VVFYGHFSTNTGFQITFVIFTSDPLPVEHNRQGV